MAQPKAFSAPEIVRSNRVVAQPRDVLDAEAVVATVELPLHHRLAAEIELHVLVAERPAARL